MSHRWLRPLVAALGVLVCLAAWADDPAVVNSRSQVKVPRMAAVGAYVLGPKLLVAGTTASYRVTVHWASSPTRSGPLPGAKVRLSLRRKGPGTLLARGRTDSTGNARLRFVVPGGRVGPHQLQVLIRSRLGRHRRTARVRLFPGGRLLLTTDKPLYQPSQKIRIRALALRSMDLRPVAGKAITFEIRDPKDNIVASLPGRTSRFGVASVDFALADEINLGRYRISAWVAGSGGHKVRQSRDVQVKRYTLPKFKVTIETDRPYYRPGDAVQGTVRGRYFFGKPVAGGRLVLSITSELGHQTTDHQHGPYKLDDQGRASFTVRLPRSPRAGAKVGQVRVLAAVTDTAKQRRRATLSVPLTAKPLRLSAVPENERLVPGVRNRLHVLAAYPDGSPAPGSQITVAAGGRKLRARADDLGVATIKLRPRAGDRRCRGSDQGVSLVVSARDRLGQRGQLVSCAPLAPRGSVLLRPTRSLVQPGQAVELTLAAGPAPRAVSGRVVYVDVVKAGQTLATFARAMGHGSTARVRFVPDAALFGLLELRAYRLTADGKRLGSSRMVYVDHPGKLRITARADRSTYRPGQRARVRFSVVDSRTGDGVQAALGLLAVDQALLSLAGLDRSDPKTFFTLASQLRGPVKQLPARPGGKDLSHWVRADKESAARRRRAADVLLAAARPADAEVFETNPWQERKAAWAAQAPTLIEAARRFVATHSVGRRTSRGWRFHRDLVPRMATARAVKPRLARDPWRRVVRPWHLRQTDNSFSFNAIAEQVAPRELAQIYGALRKTWRKLSLPRERMRKLPRKQWPLVLPPDLLRRLVRRGSLKRHQVIDPWGQTFKVRRRPRVFVNPYYNGLVSRYLIYSAGPDGKTGTKDDIEPPGGILRVAVFGKDSVLGADAEDALGGLIGDQIGEVYGVGGLGLVGVGRGGGGDGSGTIGLGTMGTIGRGGRVRVRSRFPETLLWRPELITDRGGNATVEFDLADSITTWQMAVTGSSAGGLLGTTSLPLRVFQDFFVDLDLPTALTQGDQLSVPVTVYNYLKTPQKVTLRLQREAWFTATGPLEQTLELGPSQVAVRYFPLKARVVGRQELTVHARSAGRGAAAVADAVRRSTRVEPDGVDHARSHAGVLRAVPVTHTVQIPATAISGTARVQLAIHPGPVSQTMDGLEGLLQLPGGCFEQTSSTTYPNLLVLQYLHRAGKLSPAVATRARRYINAGYQRLLSFEVAGGGFSWFGDAPANQVLSAYGLMEFFDMAQVHTVDPRVIKRTQRWLLSKQDKDGGWSPDKRNLFDGAVNNFTADRLRITAYIANALQHSGRRGKALTRAVGFVRRNAARANDAYTLAVVANLLATRSDPLAEQVRMRLWSKRRVSAKGIYLPGPTASLTHGAGASGRIETTALAALALLGGATTPRQAHRLVDTLVASKDRRGAWHSTQATILSLRALLLQQRRTRSRPHGAVQVLVDGKLRRTLRLRRGEDRAHRLDLTPFAATAGDHRVALRFTGQGSLQYHLVNRYWLPHQAGGGAAPRPTGSLDIATRYDRRSVKTGQPLRLTVELRNRGKTRVQMPLVSLALPPGLDLNSGALEALVTAGKVSKVQRVGNRALLYLTRLKARQTLRLTLGLRSRYPLRVQARPSVIYEYYRPENRAQTPPQLLQVLQVL